MGFLTLSVTDLLKHSIKHASTENDVKKTLLLLNDDDLEYYGTVNKPLSSQDGASSSQPQTLHSPTVKHTNTTLAMHTSLYLVSSEFSELLQTL